MGRPKKVIEEVVEEKVEEVVEPVEVVEAPKKVLPLELDFGRADLNQLRDKLNEVINSL